eukprot:CAMPEP_0119535244 /NCGR_PEP_ID=MMETSP1344-20130328/48320_1 /TAXON_ID=236787 /ORGANISM="Florenciella parvula, Strain CCMP2471" /LENGTH=89 /DNA_ID=CAMNT_0007576781 /DNA_START=114 /DNA_END=379 /DNA_ORIENTATION=+
MTCHAHGVTRRLVLCAALRRAATPIHISRATKCTDHAAPRRATPSPFRMRRSVPCLTRRPFTPEPCTVGDCCDQRHESCPARPLGSGPT